VERESFIEFLVDHGAYEIFDETHDRRTLIGCRFDPEVGKGLDELSRAVSESDLNPFFLTYAPVDPPDWDRPLVATRISPTMATLGMAANSLPALRHIPGCKDDSGRLSRFSRYAGQAQAYTLVDGSLSERTKWIMRGARISRPPGAAFL
jgi:hypothetical protein